MDAALFKLFELETCSYCNRTCPTCLRNSHPDKQAVAPWFEQTFLPTETIHDLLGQLVRMGFQGPVCLQHYNEPLLDPRIAELGRYAKGLKQFHHVFMCTSGDFIDEKRAADLDGAFDELQISLYMNADVARRRTDYLKALFKKTLLSFTGGVHIPTHFSPSFPVLGFADAYRNRPCTLPQKRLIINHRGECLLCCDDLVGNFGLGNIRDHSLEELWFGERHQQIIRDLEVAGGRNKHPYCASCPRP